MGCKRINGEGYAICVATQHGGNGAMSKRHVALYGNIRIPRRYCERCKCMTLVVDGMRSCCGYSNSEDFATAKPLRMSAARGMRKKPGPALAAKLLELQERKCFYCEQTLGEYVTKYGKRVRLITHYDHVEPFMFSQNNYPYNFVAACHVCNFWKGSKSFQSVDVAKDYLVRKWEANRWGRARKKDRVSLVNTVDQVTSSAAIGNITAPVNVAGMIGTEDTQES